MSAPFFHLRKGAYLLTLNRVDEDDKLRDKVQDALAVYNEYLKTAPRQQGEANQSEGTQSDEPANHDAEEVAPNQA